MGGIERKKALVVREIKIGYYYEKRTTKMKKNRLKVIPSGHPIFSL